VRVLRNGSRKPPASDRQRWNRGWFARFAGSTAVPASACPRPSRMRRAARSPWPSPAGFQAPPPRPRDDQVPDRRRPVSPHRRPHTIRFLIVA